MSNPNPSTVQAMLANPILFVSHPQGKLQDILAITSSCLCNEFCKKMHLNIGMVCHECYAVDGLEFKSASRIRYRRNTELLSESLIPDDLLPNFYCVDVARFETHGDWVNLTHAVNEMRIAQRNPKTEFTVWTKRVDLLVKLVKAGYTQPTNFHIKVSSPMLNRTASQRTKEWLTENGWNVTFFTVYNLKGLIAEYGVEYLREHGDEVITCGGRDCRSCMKCYGNHPMTDVVELLKQDVCKAKKLGVKIGQ